PSGTPIKIALVAPHFEDACALGFELAAVAQNRGRAVEVDLVCRRGSGAVRGFDALDAAFDGARGIEVTALRWDWNAPDSSTWTRRFPSMESIQRDHYQALVELSADPKVRGVELPSRWRPSILVSRDVRQCPGLLFEAALQIYNAIASGQSSAPR